MTTLYRRSLDTFSFYLSNCSSNMVNDSGLWAPFPCVNYLPFGFRILNVRSNVAKKMSQTSPVVVSEIGTSVQIAKHIIELATFCLLTLKFVQYEHVAQTLWADNLLLLEWRATIEPYFVDVIFENTFIVQKIKKGKFNSNRDHTDSIWTHAIVVGKACASFKCNINNWVDGRSEEIEVEKSKERENG